MHEWMNENTTFLLWKTNIIMHLKEKKKLFLDDIGHLKYFFLNKVDIF